MRVKFKIKSGLYKIGGALNEYIITLRRRPILTATIFALPLFVIIISRITVSQVPINDIRVAYVNLSTSNQSREFNDKFASTLRDSDSSIPPADVDIFTYYSDIDTEDKIRQAVSDGIIDVGVLIPPEFGDQKQNNRVDGAVLLIANSNSKYVETVENVVVRVLEPLNEAVNVRENGRSPLQTYSPNIDKIDADRVETTPSIVTDGIVFAIPPLCLLFLLIINQALKTWAAGSRVKFLKSSVYDLLISGLIVGILSIVLFVITKNIVFSGYKTLLSSYTTPAIFTLASAWLLALVISFAKTNKRKDGSPKNTIKVT